MIVLQNILAAIEGLLASPIASAIGTLVLAYFAYRLGMRAYFRQKEVEHIRNRYLDNGVDLAAAQLDHALSIFRHNWALSLRLLKTLRDADEPVDTHDYFAQFRELDPLMFQLVPARRVALLTDANVFWTAYQKAFSFVTTRNDMMKSDFALTLGLIANEPNHPDKKAFIAKSEAVLYEASDAAGPHYVLLTELTNLAESIGRMSLTHKDLEGVRTRPEIKVVIERLAVYFPPVQDIPHTSNEANRGLSL